MKSYAYTLLIACSMMFCSNKVVSQHLFESHELIEKEIAILNEEIHESFKKSSCYQPDYKIYHIFECTLDGGYTKENLGSDDFIKKINIRYTTKNEKHSIFSRLKSKKFIFTSALLCDENDELIAYYDLFIFYCMKFHPSSFKGIKLLPKFISNNQYLYVVTFDPWGVYYAIDSNRNVTVIHKHMGTDTANQYSMKNFLDNEFDIVYPPLIKKEQKNTQQ